MKQHIPACITLLLACFYKIHEAESSNILVLMMMGTKSHRIAFNPLFNELGSRGHKLTILSHSPNSISHENITEITGFSTEEIFDFIVNPYEERLNSKKSDVLTMGPLVSKVCQHFYEKPEVQNLLNQIFNLIMIDGTGNECSFGIASQFKSVPYILITSMPPATFLTSFLGIPSTPSLKPMSYSTSSFKSRMNYWERAYNLFEYLNFEFNVKHKYFRDVEAGYKSYFPDSPSIPEFLTNVSLILSNSHVSIDYSLAQSDLIEVGGIHCRPAKALPQELDNFLSSSGEDGFIYFSMGSVLPGSQMPVKIRQTILNVFSKLKQKVLWKFETNEFEAELPPNVKLTKWVSQQDVLGHKNIRLFITHAGFLSYQEAAFHGVPIIGIPMFCDQFVNIQLAYDRGFGLEQDFAQLTEESFSGLIHRIITEPSFNKNAKMVSNNFRTRYEDPLKTAVFWVEFFTKFERPTFLQAYARELNFFQYHSLDIIIPAMALGTVLILVLLIIVKSVVLTVMELKFFNKEMKFKTC